MSLESKVLYEFGKFRYDPAEHLLLADGKSVSLTPKAFEILSVLIQSKGRLVTKEDLMRAAWPDSFVEEANLTVNISALRKALGETAQAGQFIETVPKKGYRFVAPVTESRAESPATSGPVRHAPMSERGPTVGGPKKSIATRIVLALAVGLMVAILVSQFIASRNRSAATRAPQVPRRLAILPFRNLGQQSDTDFLGLSLADAVITKLGYVSALAVKPSYAVERYRNQPVDMQRIGRELNVDTLLMGSYIRDHDDLRITCQLIDLKNENLLWKGAFDLKYERLLSVQDNVAQEIIKGLSLTLSPSEAERLKPQESVDPLGYEYYLRGVDLYARGEFPIALKMLEKSVEIAPNYAPTWAYLGRTYTANASFQFGGKEQYRKAQDAFERALSLQPAQIESRIFMANLLTDTGRVEQAVPLLREALRTNPNHAEIHWELGYAYRYAGMLKESVAECERARQIDPGVKLTSSALNAYLYLGEYDKFLRSLPQNEESPLISFYRGFAYFYEGKFSEATSNFDHAFELDRSLFQAEIGKALSYGISHREQEGLTLLRDAQRKIEERGVGDPEAIYKLAQAYSVLGDKASALRVLRHTVEVGFFSYPYFSVDPLLDNLRNENDFAEIMKLAQDRHEAFKKNFF
ncbi:MAG TPA: winged helix-turn-helix domain-containing protein [Terriglobales bacterium]|nr:winged helix-turn-helix domain-containing protein [Terriglobales bacterium]